MTDELPGDAAEERIDHLDDIGRKTVKVAASAVLATTLVGALSEPPDTNLIKLPEPVPIVQQYQAVDEDDDVDDDRKKDTRTDRLRRLLKLLKYLIIALLFVGTLLFGVLKGCAGVVGATLLPGDDEQQEQKQEGREQVSTEAVPASWRVSVR